MLPVFTEIRERMLFVCLTSNYERFQECILLYQLEEGKSGPELSLVFNVSCSFHSYSVPVY